MAYTNPQYGTLTTGFGYFAHLFGSIELFGCGQTQCRCLDGIVVILGFHSIVTIICKYIIISCFLSHSKVWFQNRRSKERRMKQLSSMGARRHFFRSPRRAMRPLRPGLSPDGLEDSPEMVGGPNNSFGYFSGIAKCLILCE